MTDRMSKANLIDLLRRDDVEIEEYTNVEEDRFGDAQLTVILSVPKGLVDP